MISVSNDFKKAMKQPIKELDAYIKIDEETKITSSDDLVSLKISCESGMCKTTMRKFEAKILGEHNLLGQWVHVGFGVKLPNGTYEYINYGSFLITEINKSKDTDVTKITGYDKMINTMKSYTPLEINYPVNLYDYTLKLCEVCGLEMSNESFVHSDWMITEDLWKNINGITYRDIFVQIAQATASTCIISDDKILFKYLTNVNEQLTYDNMKKLKLEPLYGEINSVVLSRTPQEDNIYMRDEESIEVNGLTEFKIENNEIIDGDRDGALPDIYEQLHGISYYPFEVTTEGLGWYEIGDAIEIKDDIEDSFKIAVFNFSIQVDGGINEILKAVAETKTQTQYQYASPINKRFSRIEIITDKQGKRIDAVVEDVDEATTKVTEMEMEVGKLSTTVSESVQIVGLIENQVSENTTNINNNYQELIEQLDTKADTDVVTEVTNKVETLQTSTEYTINVLEDIQVNGVTKVDTGTGYKFDSNGMQVDKTNAPTGGVFNDAGMEIVDKLTSALKTLFYSGYVNQDMADKVEMLNKYLGQTVTYSDSLLFSKYLSSRNMRIEDVDDETYGKGLAFFYIGGDS